MCQFPTKSQGCPPIWTHPPETRSLFSLVGLKCPLTNFPADDAGVLDLIASPLEDRILLRLRPFVDSAREIEVPQRGVR